MKKKLLTGISALACICSSFGQTVPNGSFENWMGNNYDIAQFYAPGCVASNLRSLQVIGQTTTSKTTDFYHGAYAVMVQTKSNGMDTCFGFFANGNPGTNSRGGTPYSQRPTSLRGYYKCGVQATDTAFVVVQFKSGGTTLFLGSQKFYGTHAAYSLFTIPIVLPPSPAPDTVIIGAVSSNAFMNNYKGMPGSFLQIDSLTFTGGVSQPVNSNLDFEMWNTGTLNVPNGWRVNGDSIQRSTTAYTGTYSILMEVSNSMFGNGVDQATTGHFRNNGGPVGGYPYSLLSDSLVGFYKLTSVGMDTAAVYWTATHLHAPVGGFMKLLTASATYKRFSMPVNPGSVPDTLLVGMSASSAYGSSAGRAGSKFWVDGLQVLSQPLGIPLILAGKQTISTYPNPGTGIFNLLYDSGSNEPVVITVYNLVGQEILRKQLNPLEGSKILIDLTGFGKGAFVLRAEQEGRVSMQRIIVQ